MPRRINGPQNREQLQMMVEAVRGEVNLAQDLVNSYEQDLANLEADTTLPANDKDSRRVFLETAIKESRDLLNLRQKQLKSIDPMRGGKAAGQARREVWNDTTIESKGMNAIMQEKSNIVKEEKHTQDISKLQAERQARSEAVRNAATALATAANKLADEKQAKENSEANFMFIKRPDFVEGSNRWDFIDKSESGRTYIYGDPDNQNVRYIYNPEISEVIKSEIIGKKRLNNVFDIKSGTWMQFPEEYLNKKNWHYDGLEGKWREYKLGQEQSQDHNLEDDVWQVPVYDQNGNLVFETKTDEEMINKRSEEETKQMAEQIEKSILGKDDDKSNIKLDDNKFVYRKQREHLSLFQKIKQWFMRLFNKNYQLPEPTNKYIYRSDRKAVNGEKLDNNDKTVYTSEKEKRTIKGFYLPKVKKFFKDNKRTIMILSATALASIAVAAGINARKAYNKGIIEEKARQEQMRQEEEKQRELEEQQALQEAKEQQTEEQEDTLVKQDGKTLTTGSIKKQYVANEGLEYTENALGNGNRRTLQANTVVEIFNRAIVKENDDGTKQVILTAKGKTWDDFCKESGMSIEEIQNLLKQDKTYEMAAIQIGGTNHNIFNTYGWVKTSDLEKSSKDTENLKDFEITTGDNTEILEQLQNQEQEGER